MDLPYKAEYAKSGRASCRGCKSTIEKDTLRLAVMVQSPMFDGKTPQWYHKPCFFRKQRPKTVDDIEHFLNLRWEDQESIKSKITNGAAVIVPDKKGKKRAGQTAVKKEALKDFLIEYSKSGRAACRGCEQKIMKDEIRVSKKDFESDVGRRYGGQDKWHHLTCFAKIRSELGYYESASVLPGFKTLSKEDQQNAMKELPAIKQEEMPEKKLKVEDEVDASEDSGLEKKLKEQNIIMFKYRDKLKELPKKDLKELLEFNDQAVPPGVDEPLNRLADLMTFGTLLPCKECEGGQFVFCNNGYECHGNLSEWSKCLKLVKEPPRTAFKVPAELAEEYSFLKTYKYVPRTRAVKDLKPTASVKKDEENDTGPKVQRALPPLYNMEFVLLGALQGSKELKAQISKLGGKVVTKIKETVMAVISTEADVEKMGARMTEASTVGIQVVPEEFLDEAPNYVGRIPELVLAKNISSWGSDPHTRLPPEPSSSMSSLKSKSKSMFSSVPGKVKMKVKGGTAVDPDSGLEDCTHVYVSGKDKYAAVLGLTDIQKQKNSYYKLQLLESDTGRQYYLFRSWGRIGTTIGGNKVDNFSSLMEAKQQFISLYEEKTGNRWQDRDSFVKVAGRMYPIDVDFGEEEETKLNLDSDVPSKLKKEVQELIGLIFNVNNMKKVMLEFELDTEKMPLGKLSKAQLQSAYVVLTELQQLVETNASEARFIDASNRFYTFVPHSFGTDNPPLINDLELIKKKIEMVDNLMELEVAYNLMKATGGNNTIDGHYDQLKTEIDVLDQKSEEFKIIKKYVKNTHAATHSNYKLTVDQIFIIKRHGEEKRYKPFRKLHNRRLLWHGSRTTNYAGILAQGLRIAPPEAPVTGYMFGKGIYFADMVSKSANYCCTSSVDNTGLMLLSEVALGEMHELYNASYIEKLPKGKHSVKGVGRTEPDPKETIKLKDNTEVPLGKGIQMDLQKNTSLLYNEYIVYDVAQVNIKYLLKMKFNYQY
uniref:Poly [ADP-ribose] polymerase n=1 Tax=Photinus pyralis TaxID=7054 RepID=A0A1Y1KWX6_PHOPY